MLIPSIDLKHGKIVQLVQGRDQALETDAFDVWIDRFTGYPRVQLIDLDAAMDEGDNDALVKRFCAALPCRVGGGIRTVDRAQRVLDAGATAVILGSSLFRHDAVDVEFVASVERAITAERFIGAVDCKGGRIAVKGWRGSVALTAVEAVRALEPYCAEFLYTHVDTEGLMQGTDLDAIRAVRAATSRRLTAAGGITTQQEIDLLDDIKVDAVVGMAIYTEMLTLSPRPKG